ncbi:MAG TPA: PqiC family protein [Rhodospirillales bacterium]|nr:PqiC family protein [Rhodospirillales bacterium]
MSKAMLSKAAALALAVALVTGCSNPFTAEREPTNFFVLTALPQAQAPAPARDGPFIGVVPVRLPEYLNHNVIVTRENNNELALAKFNEWAAPLSANITSVLTENLSMLIPTDRIATLPANVATDREVSVEIINFERDAKGDVVLLARWTIIGDSGRRLLAMRRSGFRAEDVPMDYGAIAAAMRHLLGELSRDIAAEINAGSRRRA